MVKINFTVFDVYRNEKLNRYIVLDILTYKALYQTMRCYYGDSNFKIVKSFKYYNFEIDVSRDTIVNAISDTFKDATIID